jgi:hypothetical protein
MRFPAITLCSLLASSAAPFAANLAFDAYADFGNTNPNGEWSYGFGGPSTLNSARTLYNEYTSGQTSAQSLIPGSDPGGLRQTWDVLNQTRASGISANTFIVQTSSLRPNRAPIPPGGNPLAGTMVSGLHVQGGFSGQTAVLGLAPSLQAQTTFQISFDLSSDYGLGQATDDDGSIWAGQMISLWINDTIIPGADWWGGNPSAVRTSGFFTDHVFLAQYFAHFTDPIVIDHEVQLNPGDTIYLRLNPNNSTGGASGNGADAFDGIVLANFTVTEVPEPGSALLSALAIGVLARRRRLVRG